MNKKLVMHLKKVMFSIVMGTSVLGATIPSANLYAATTAATKTKQMGTVSIKDVTLTAHDITPAKNEGEFKISMTMEKTSGIPKNVAYMLINASTDLEIGGKKKVEFILDQAEITKKVSDTQVELSVYAFAMVRDKDNNILQQQITLDQLKGKTIDFKLDSITYYAEYTEPTPEFKEQFKKVSKLEGVTAAQTNIGLDQEDIQYIGGAKLLPHGGLNIPAISGNTVLLDNIGFVDGKLVVRIEHAKGEFFQFGLVDEAGKFAKTAGYFGTEIGGIYRYEIGDLETLAQYTPTLKLDKEVAKDEEKGIDGKNVIKTFLCKF